MTDTYYNIRYMARIIIEMRSPLQIGNGQKNILTDSPVLRDVNGLPFIPGSTLAGVIRHALSCKENENRLMGYQSESGGEASRLIPKRSQNI